jgi:flagellar hook-associated protein 3 FlgL
MRVSTNTIFEAGVRAINNQTASLLNIQQQISAGKRILTPSDDPVAAARALEVTQATTIIDQFKLNQENAEGALGLEEANLISATDLIGRVRELTVQAGNTLLSSSDRKALAFELRSRFDELMGIANATDGSGQYMFAGYMGTTRPFGGTVDEINEINIAAPTGNVEVNYNGDEGQRRLQVATGRYLEVSDSGTAIFKYVKEGNGTFVTGYQKDLTMKPTNVGTGMIDAGSITSPTTWNNLTNKNFEIKFALDRSVSPATTYYDVYDTTTGVSQITGGASPFVPTPVVPLTPAALTGLRVYHDGQPIQLPNLGISVLITGAPSDNANNLAAPALLYDGFTIAPSESKSVFKTIAQLVHTLETGTTQNAAATAILANDVGFALSNLDQSTDSILRTRAGIGARMKEVESLGSVNEDLKLQYQQTLAQLQDLDYAKTITDLTRKQTDLQAAQQSFSRISGMSLFNYIS